MSNGMPENNVMIVPAKCVGANWSDAQELPSTAFPALADG